MVKLVDVLGGVSAAAGGFQKGWNEEEEKRSRKRDRENRERREDLSQLLAWKKYEHMLGESERKQRQEKDKQLKGTIDDLAKADLLEYYVDQYISNKEKSLSGMSLLGVGDVSIPGTKQYEADKIAQNFQQPVTGLLTSMDNLGKTQKIFEKFTEAENAKTVEGIRAVGKAIKTQIKGMRAGILTESGLSPEEAKGLNSTVSERFSLFKNHFDEISSPEVSPQEKSKQQQFKDELSEGSQNEVNALLPGKEDIEPPPGEAPQKKSLFDRVSDTGVLGLAGNLVSNDIGKSIPEGLGKVGMNVLKFLTPNVESVEGKPHDHLSRVGNALQDKYREGVQIEDPNSWKSKTGRFLGEAAGYTALAPSMGGNLPGMAGAITDGALIGMLEKPEELAKGAAIGALEGGVLHKALGAIASIPTAAKKWWLKWAGKHSKNSPETAERLTKAFTGEEVSLGQTLNNPAMIQTERTIGLTPFSGVQDTAKAMAHDLEAVSEKLAGEFKKDPGLVSKEIREMEATLMEESKKLYTQALGEEAENLVLSPEDLRAIIARDYTKKPDVKQLIDGVETLSNNELKTIWDTNRQILENLWESGNKDAYIDLYRKLDLPNFWDLHWFNSDLKYLSKKYKNSEHVESVTRHGLFNDHQSVNKIISKYAKQKEYQAATDYYREVISPYKDRMLRGFHEAVEEGKNPSYGFFKNEGDKAKKVYDRLSDDAKKATQAGVIDPQAEQLSLRSFTDMPGNRGNKAASKLDHLLTDTEKQRFGDLGQMNHMLSDLQTERLLPKTGKALEKILKNPIAGVLTAGSSLLAPKTLAGLAVGIPASRQLAKSLRKRSNLKYYTKPEILDEVIRKKRLKHRHRLPMQALSQYNREEE